MEQEKQSPREYMRIDTKVEIGSRALTRAEAVSAQSRYSGFAGVVSNFPEPPPLADPHLNTYLSIINAKLDALLANQAVTKMQGGIPLKLHNVNISAGGLVFPAENSYKPGETIEVHIVLPMSNPIGLILIGRVMKITGNFTRVQFVNTPEEIESKIAEFVFFKERQILSKGR